MEIAGLQKELNKESKKVDKAVMDLGLLEFRVATAEQEKITLDQRIQAHKAELKQQQAFIAKLEAEKAEIANIVNKTRDELTAAKETAHTLQRQAIDSSRSWPRPRHVRRNLKPVEELFFLWRSSLVASPALRSSPDAGEYENNTKTSSDFLSTHSSQTQHTHLHENETTM